MKSLFFASTFVILSSLNSFAQDAAATATSQPGAGASEVKPAPTQNPTEPSTGAQATSLPATNAEATKKVETKQGEKLPEDSKPTSAVARAEEVSNRSYGLSLGLAVPYLVQGALHFKASNWLSVSLGYGSFSGDVGVAKVSLSMPEAILAIHPFQGSFFIGAGFGQQKLSASAVDSTTGLSAKVDTSANTTIVKLGWMWGFKTPGLFYGMDISYITPSGGNLTITSPGLATTTSAYKDVQDAGKKVNETSYPNITLARFGYMF